MLNVYLRQMANYRVKQDQTLFDLAIQLYGDAGQIFRIIDDNPVITEVLLDITGLTIEYDDTVNTNLINFLKTNKINIVTGSRLVEAPSSFDDSFDDSFT